MRIQPYSIIYLIVAMNCCTVYCQVDSVLGFYPLHTGNVVQYNYHYSYNPLCSDVKHSSYQKEIVAGDTLLSTGYRYKIITDGFFIKRFVRIDTLTACVYTYSDQKEYLSDSLRITPGGVFTRGSSLQTKCIGIDTIPVLGVKTIVKRFQINSGPGRFDYSLAYGFGLIQDIRYNEDCYPGLVRYYRDIVFSNINGKEFGTLVTVKDRKHLRPEKFKLYQNYPNPFNPSTVFEFFIPRSEFVSFRIYNMLGQEVAVLLSQKISSGIHKVNWNASNVVSGIYYCRLQVGDYYESIKVVLIR